MNYLLGKIVGNIDIIVVVQPSLALRMDLVAYLVDLVVDCLRFVKNNKNNFVLVAELGLLSSDDG